VVETAGFPRLEFNFRIWLCTGSSRLPRSALSRQSYSGAATETPLLYMCKMTDLNTVDRIDICYSICTNYYFADPSDLGIAPACSISSASVLSV